MKMGAIETDTRSTGATYRATLMKPSYCSSNDPKFGGRKQQQTHHSVTTRGTKDYGIGEMRIYGDGVVI